MHNDQNNDISLCKLNETSMSANETEMMTCDVGHLTSLRIEFQTKEKTEESEQSPSVYTLHAGLFRRYIVCELERVLRECDGFFCRIQFIYDGAVMTQQ